MKNNSIKKPIYKKVEANLLRKLFNRDKQLVRAKRVARELWDILKKVGETK